MNLYDPKKKQMKEIFLHLDQCKLNKALQKGDHLTTIDIFFKQPKAVIVEKQNYHNTSEAAGITEKTCAKEKKKSNKLLKHHGKPKAKKSTTKNSNKGSSIKTAKEAKPMIASKDHK